MKILAYIVGAIGILACILGLGLLMAFPLMWALNYVFTSAVLMALFGVSKLTFWKTVILSWVIAFLFKSTSTSK
jgi:hypothetical protein